jgi:hypothetical protein
MNYSIALDSAKYFRESIEFEIISSFTDMF